MTALVIIEYNHGILSLASQCAITAALQMAKTVKACVFGEQGTEIAQVVSKIAAVEEVYLFNHSVYNHNLAEPCADAVVQFYKQYSTLSDKEQNTDIITHIVAAATTFGKNILPRIAAKLNVSQVSDIIKVIDGNTYQRPIYAGNAIATIQSKDVLQMVTVRATAFNPAKIVDHNAMITPLDIIAQNSYSTFIKCQSQPTERPELNHADIVISGGRGLGDAVNFNRLAKIAERLNAALGASRAAVDAGFAPNELQVGQTGQIVAPKLYIAVGISGALQHLAGMKDSKIIVAINRDPEAPIFQVADYGLVADITEVLKEWETSLED
jgi:electron transfer flavoprotein alpha subunit